MELGKRLFSSVPAVRSSWRRLSCDPCGGVLLSPRLLTSSRGTATHIFSIISPIRVVFSVTTRHLSTSSNASKSISNNRSQTKGYGHVAFLDERRNSFDDSQEPRQFLSRDRQIIVCVHPTRPTPISESKPLRPLNPSVQALRDALTPEEVKVVRRLRAVDGALWTVNTLARHFNVRRRVISEVAPASLERQRELDEEKAKMAAMRPYKRKLYKAQKQMERQKRLEELVAKNREQLRGKS